MPTPQNPQTDTPRVPGWRRVLDAFMADPERTLTNIQLAGVPGVQAFHQRITDLGNYGYVLTPAVKLSPGRYAYAVVAIAPSAPWPFRGPRPYADQLDALEPERIGAAVNVAVAALNEKGTALLERDERQTIRPVRSVVEQARAMRDAAACLAVALGDAVVGDWPSEDRTNVLALATAARDEIGRVRSLRALEQANGEAEQVRKDALELLVAVLPEDARVGDRTDDLLGLLEVATAARDEIERLRAALNAKSAAPRRVREPRVDRGPTGPQLMRKALEHCEQPMHTARLAEWVLANGGDAIYKGATPDATMAAQLATSNKRGGEFVKVAPGCYGLREWGPDPQRDDEPLRDEFGNPLLELDPVR